MTRKPRSKIVHFDIDKLFAPFFKEKKYNFSLKRDNFKKINQPEKLEIITAKSNSKINDDVLQKFPKLKAIITRTVGTNHINLKSCKGRNIAVYRIPDYGAFAVAEHVFAMLLAQTRKIISLREETTAGKFNWGSGQGFTLKNKTLGIIGVGRTGKETVKIAKGFQMKVLGFDRVKDSQFAKKYNLQYLSLDKLLTNSDVISINIPLLPKTFHLIGREEIKKMKNGVILVNVSRGEIVDTKTLVDNLGKFRYVCLDVLEGEEHYDLKNSIIKKLVNSKKVLITPHVAFFTDLTAKNIAKITYQNIDNFLKRKRENRVV